MTTEKNRQILLASPLRRAWPGRTTSNWSRPLFVIDTN